jgi:DNA-binding response OmpR family regulator
MVSYDLASRFEQAGLYVAQRTELDITLGTCGVDHFDVLVVVANDLSKDHIEVCRRLRHRIEQPLLLFSPTYDEDYFVRAYQAGVDECMIDTVGCELLLAKVFAWLRWAKRDTQANHRPRRKRVAYGELKH